MLLCSGNTKPYVCGGIALLNFMGFMCLHRTRVKWVTLKTAMEITRLPLVSVPNAAETRIIQVVRHVKVGVGDV